MDNYNRHGYRYKTDKRKEREELIQLYSIKEIQESLDKGDKIVLQTGEAWDDGNEWNNDFKTEIAISGDDFKSVHNDGPGCLIYKVSPSYDEEKAWWNSFSYVDCDGVFRRRQGHEHIARVFKIVSILPPFLKQVKNGYMIGGHFYSEHRLRISLNFAPKQK